MAPAATQAEATPDPDPPNSQADPDPVPAPIPLPSLDRMPSATAQIASSLAKDPGPTDPPVNEPVGAATDPSPGPSAEDQVPATFGGQATHVLPDGGVDIGGTHVQAGDPAITIEDTRISVDSQAIHIGASIFTNLGSHDTLDPAPSSIAGQTIRVDRTGALVVGDEVIRSGKQMDVDGNHISVAHDHMVINGKAYAMPPGPAFASAESSVPDPGPTISGHSMRPVADGAVVVDGSTMSQGQSTVVDGNTVKIASDSLIINGKTYPLSALATKTPAADSVGQVPPKVDGETVEAASDGGVILGDSSIALGHSTNIHGTYVSVGPKSLVIGSSTYSAPTITSNDIDYEPSLQAWSGVVMHISTATNGALVIGSSTLLSDTQMTLSGIPICVGSGKVVVQSSTYSITDLSSLLNAVQKGTPTGKGMSPTTTVTVGSGTPSEALGLIIASMFGYAASPSSSDSASTTVDADSSATYVDYNGTTSAVSSDLSLFTGAQSRVIVQQNLLLSAMVLCIYVGATVAL